MMQYPYIYIPKEEPEPEVKDYKRTAVGLNAKKKSVGIEASHGELPREHNGYISSCRANGGYMLSKEHSRALRTDLLQELIRKTGKFEAVWYPTFIILGLLCLVLIPIFTKQTTIQFVMLLFAVLSLWLSMCANNLVARGVRFGLLLCTVNMALYSIVCIYQKVWGEAAINILLYIPLELIGFFNWKKKATDGGKVAEVKKMDAKTLTIFISMLVGIALAVFGVLKLPFINQKFAIFNAISISGCLVGDIARNKQYKEVWYFFMICNIAGITMWACQVFAGGGGLTLEVLPAMVSSCATLSNNFNGLAIWNVLYKNSQKSKGVYLAMRPVNIKKITKLKRTFRNLKCKEI